MSYRIKLRSLALNELEDLPRKVNQAISSEIDKLAFNPRPIGSKKIPGRKACLWRIRVGEYRIIYTIEDAVKILEVSKPYERISIPA